jgi:RimJ/RimL family protein N-acetyltransferase
MPGLAHNTVTQLEPFTIETPNFVLRLLRPEDATDRWAEWFTSAEVRAALNMPEKSRDRADMVAYINGYDQRNRVLVGAFDKANGLLVCIGSAQIDWQKSNYLISTVVGEAAYRNAGVMTELTPPFRDYFFDNLGLRTSTATALSTNTVIRTFLENTGWTQVNTLRNHIRRHSDGAMVDLCLYLLTREAWSAWKAANLRSQRSKTPG